MLYIIEGEEELFIKNKIKEIIKKQDCEVIKFDGASKDFNMQEMLELIEVNAKSEYVIDIGQAIMHKESGVLDLPVTLNFVIPASDIDNIKYAIIEKLPFVKDVKFDIKYKEPLIRKTEEKKMDSFTKSYNTSNPSERKRETNYRGRKELKANGNFVMGRTITGEKNCELIDISPEKGTVIIEGEIYKIDSRVIKSGNLLVSILITDNKTTVCCKGFVSEEKFAEIKPNIALDSAKSLLESISIKNIK